MNTDKLRLWIDALRSGEFDQARGWLASKNTSDQWGYCCLGVACEVAIKDGVDVPVEVTGVRGSQYRVYGGDDQHLPSNVREWLGIDETPEVPWADPDYPLDAPESTTVIVLNDEKEWTFGQIADALEATYLDGDMP